MLLRMDQVLPAGFRSALKDLRNRAVHLFDTNMIQILESPAIAKAVGEAAAAFRSQLKLLIAQSQFLSGAVMEPPPRHDSGFRVFSAINAAAQALPRIQLDFDVIGQTIGNLQQLDETLTVLKALNLTVGQVPGFELLQEFVAAVKEFRSARTHGGFTNFPALHTSLMIILKQTAEVAGALKQLKVLVARKAPFADKNGTD